jgi:ligand-binding sensor domain-containing protein
MLSREQIICIIRTTGIFIILYLTNACEKTAYDLIDPGKTDKWTLFSTSTGLPGNQIRGIKGDSKGNMWFAVSSKGVAKYSDDNWAFYNTSNSGIISNGITCIEEDLSGNIYFGTVNGYSVLSAANTWSSFRPSFTLSINAIKATRNNGVWIGTQNQGFLIVKGTQITQYNNSLFANVYDIEEDSKGNIFLATDNGVIKWDGNNYTLITTSNGLPDNEVTALFNDSKGRLWIGTYYGKTVTWIDSQGTHQLSFFNGGAICEINDIWEDIKGNIWFATYDNGLIRYDGIIPTAYKVYNGFPENDIISVGGNNDGVVWFGLYSKGLVKYTLPLD